jgi:hypothetical protein
MKTKQLVTITQIAGIIAIFIGFRLATQAGQDMGLPQNDGYAMSGGLVILVGGIIIGYTLRYGFQGRKK